MALVQRRLVPLYREVPFGPGWWAFSFSYAATVAYGIEWSTAEHVRWSHLWTWVLLAVVTAGIGTLAVRTGRAVVHGRFFSPRTTPAT